MLSIQALSQKIGKKILYIGTECYSWAVTDFAKAARNARAMGFDTICPKRLDGTIKWYHTAGHLQLERNAVLSEGVGFLPFAYSYAPRFNTVGPEVAAWQEIANVNDGLVVVDLEVEWDGQNTPYAVQLAAALKSFKGDVIVSTWGDPQEQSWMEILSTLDPVVSAWSPQQYTDWLAGREKAEWSAELGKLFPSLDITGEYGDSTHPIDNAKAAYDNKHPTIFCWEYSEALTNPELIKGVLAFFGGTIPNVNPTPIPNPPSPNKKVKWETYIVREGDSLFSIVAMLQAKNLANTTIDALYAANKTVIENTAKQHGYPGSNNGSLIFPGTQLVYPAL